MSDSARKQTVTLGLVQLSCGEDVAANIERTATRVREAASRGADVICLQELYSSRYFCQVEDPAYCDLAEPFDGPSVQRMAVIAKETGTTLIVPFYERRAPGLYHNSLVVLGPDGAELGRYRKMHIPDDPQYLEKFYFTPGDLGFVCVNSPKARLGTLICWDQWYPEAARLTALRGAQLLFYPTAIGRIPAEGAEAAAAQLDAWKAVMRGHAVANGCYVVACNRVGWEPSPAGGEHNGIEFWGHSFVIDPFGRVLEEAGEEEGVLIVECDLAVQEETRRWWPFLRDRRIDAYGDLTRRFID